MSTPNRSPRVMYLSWGENWGLNPLVRNQVLGQLRAIASLDRGLTIQLVIGVPLVSRKSLRSPRVYAADLRSLAAAAHADGIDLRYHWIPALSSWFHSRWWQLPFYYAFNLLQVAWRLARFRPDVVHARSYHATLLALLVRRLFGRDYRVVFDTRGAFPEESVHGGFMGPDSRSFRTWKRLERWALERSDAVVSVSRGLAEHLEAHGADPARSVCIPTTADARLFQESEAGSVDGRQDVPTMVYLGVIGARSWYSLDRLGRLFLRFRAELPDAKLLVVTRSDRSEIESALSAAGVSPSDLDITSTMTPLETAALLSRAHVAVVPVRAPANPVTALLVRILIGAKTAEYLANGLPIVVFTEAREIADLVDELDVGQVVESEEALDPGELMRRRDDYRTRCRRLAEERFGATANARRYLQLYRTLLGEGEAPAR